MTTWIQHPTAVPFSQDAMNDPYGLTPRVMLRIADVLRELNIARRTLYTEPYRWLWTRAVYIGPRSPRWERTDLELFKAQRRAA